jgi:hypothetical protein
MRQPFEPPFLAGRTLLANLFSVALPRKTDRSHLDFAFLSPLILWYTRRVHLKRRWRNWQTHQLEVLAPTRHRGSSPLLRTILFCNSLKIS